MAISVVVNRAVTLVERRSRALCGIFQQTSLKTKSFKKKCIQNQLVYPRANESKSCT